MEQEWRREPDGKYESRIDPFGKTEYRSTTPLSSDAKLQIFLAVIGLFALVILFLAIFGPGSDGSIAP